MLSLWRSLEDHASPRERGGGVGTLGGELRGQVPRLWDREHGYSSDPGGIETLRRASVTDRTIFPAIPGPTRLPITPPTQPPAPCPTTLPPTHPTGPAIFCNFMARW